MTTRQETQEEEFNLLDYWRVLVKHRRLISYLAGAAFVISVAISLMLPKIYASTASILPPQQGSSLNSGIAARLSGEMGGLEGGLLDMQSPGDLWMGLLKSQAVNDAVAKELDLANLFPGVCLRDRNLSVRREVFCTLCNVLFGELLWG